MPENFGSALIQIDFHSQAQADAWEKHVNASDDRKDPCLAMEKALNECLGFDYYSDDDPIWLSPA